jgi:2-oxoglutarate dehydrogenase E1 component
MIKSLKGNKVYSKIQSKVLNLVKTSKTPFLNGTSSRYVEQMHEAWKKDPSSVHVSWKSYFENVEKGEINPIAIPSTLIPTSGASNPVSFTKTDDNSVMVIQLIRAYQKNGYLKAVLDPLRIMENKQHFPIFNNIEDLHYSKFGFKESDLEKEFSVPNNNLKEGLVKRLNGGKMKLKDLIDELEKAYCGTIGVEYKHISSRDEVNFIVDYMENKWKHHRLNKDEKIDMFKKLVWATKFEYFCDVKFTTKRFGLEGLETMIPGLQTFFEKMSDLGTKDITLGMAHRGRLNVLANLFGKPMNSIFKEFMGKTIDDQGFTYWRSGDVKYHLGYSSTKVMKNGKNMKLEILPNPSHLECVNPVVQGKVRAKQHYNDDTIREE